MPKKKFHLTPREMDDIEGALLRGEAGPEEPDHINVAKTVDEVIAAYGFDHGADYAAYRSQCAFHDEDKEDWSEVVRVIKQRQAEVVKNDPSQ